MERFLFALGGETDFFVFLLPSDSSLLGGSRDRSFFLSFFLRFSCEGDLLLSFETFLVLDIDLDRWREPLDDGERETVLRFGLFSAEERLRPANHFFSRFLYRSSSRSQSSLIESSMRWNFCLFFFKVL